MHEVLYLYFKGGDYESEGRQISLPIITMGRAQFKAVWQRI